MPIPVACSCGAKFAAGDHLAGKRVQCPKCKNPLEIPSPAQGDDDELRMEAPVQKPATMTASIFDQVGMTGLKEGQIACPGCETPIAATSVLCVHCGYHMQMGKKITGHAAKKSGGGDGHANVAESLLEKARDTIDEDKESKEREQEEGMPWYILAGIFLFATSFLIMMLMLPGEQAFLAGGGVIMATSIIAIIYNLVRLYIHAFGKNLATGLSHVIFPFYYWFAHWDVCGPHVLGIVVFVFVAAVGFGMVQIAPWMKPEEDPNKAGSALPVVQYIDHMA